MRYAEELECFEATFAEALKADISILKEAIEDAWEAGVIAVGSGGSLTVASILCSLHETATGKLSRAISPLELICNPTLSVTSPTFLISAEGKNPDISLALERARAYSSRIIEVLTNRSDSPLATLATNMRGVRVHPYEITQKDGFLATNSLLYDSVLVARAYGELMADQPTQPTSLGQLSVNGVPFNQWRTGVEKLLADLRDKKGLLIVFSPGLKAVATDLESKLSESALFFCQVADLRSFAHGRHVWLSSRDDCAVLALVEPQLKPLWTEMESLLPSGSSKVAVELDGTGPWPQIAGLIAAMEIIAGLARLRDIDPARPQIPEASRNLYYMDLAEKIAPPNTVPLSAVKLKAEALGRAPYRKGSLVELARRESTARTQITKHQINAIVLDYDGTVVHTHNRFEDPTKEMVEKLNELLKYGTVLGFATGRGPKLATTLQKALDQAHWDNTYLGYYNGAVVKRLSEITQTSTAEENPEEGTEFLNHVSRLMNGLKSLGAPIKQVKRKSKHQVSLILERGTPTDEFWFIVAETIRKAGLPITSVLKSAHSIDIVSSGVSKSQVIRKIIEERGYLPHHVLAIGDQGGWPGNDHELLSHVLSLSVDRPTTHPDRGWNFAPTTKRSVDATLWYLQNLRQDSNGLTLIV